MKANRMKRTLRIAARMLLGVVLTLPVSRAAAQTDLSDKIAAAKTAADHQAIAAQFEQEAKDLEAKATWHRDLAKHYGMDQYVHQKKPGLKEHCEKLSASLDTAAKNAAEMAKLHRELAKTASQ